MLAILHALGVDAEDGERVIEGCNKADLLDPDRLRAPLDAAAGKRAEERPAVVSALTGEGVDDLLGTIERRLATHATSLSLDLDPSDGRGLNWLYETTEILAREDHEDGTIHLTVRVAPERMARVQNRFPDAARITAAAQVTASE